MDRTVNQPVVELVLVDVHPITVRFLPEQHTGRHHRDAKLFRQKGVVYRTYCRSQPLTVTHHLAGQARGRPQG